MANKVYFQIGTNDGNDNFKKLVNQDKPDLVILVEPNKDLINLIKTNYNNVKNVFIYNKAIFYENDKTVDLVIPSIKGAYNGINGAKANNGLVYKHVHFSLFPMNDWGEKEDMVKIKADTITFDKICENHNIKNIDYLQIDTEGFDTEIIKLIDFTKYKINKIRFEKWTFSKDCYTKHCNEQANILGKNGMNNALEKLKNNNYKIYSVKDDDGDDYVGILEK
jgi:FkbM family methyltransferase